VACWGGGWAGGQAEVSSRDRVGQQGNERPGRVGEHRGSGERPRGQSRTVEGRQWELGGQAGRRAGMECARGTGGDESIGHSVGEIERAGDQFSVGDHLPDRSLSCMYVAFWS
jgi:hypothetical protein